MEFLLQLDTSLFYIINVDLQNPLFDRLMPFITERTHWFPVWGALVIGLLWKGGKKGRKGKREEGEGKSGRQGEPQMCDS